MAENIRRVMITTRLTVILIVILLVCLALVVGFNMVFPEADFTAEPTNAVGFTRIHFTDLSKGEVRSWAWDFDNDGVIDSTEQNPTYVYPTSDIYSVTLTITGLISDSSITKERYIIVIVCNGL